MTYRFATNTDPHGAAQVLTRLVRSSADIETIEAVAAAYGPDVDASSCASLAYELADAVAAADYARRAQHRAEYRATQAAARGQQAAANRASASALDWHRDANDLAAVAAETLAALVILLTEGANR